MKLYKISYHKINYKEEWEYETYLTTGNSKDEVEKREFQKLQRKLEDFIVYNVLEINEVDGHKIIVDWFVDSFM